MTFPDYDALVIESQPGVPGGEVRLALLRRGAEMERQRILGLDFIHDRFGEECREPCMTCENLELIEEGI
jgi:hypothetical protein